MHQALAAQLLQGESAEEKSAKAAAKREAKMQSVLRALGVLASTSGVTAERQTFMNLVTAPAVVIHCHRPIHVQRYRQTPDLQ